MLNKYFYNLSVTIIGIITAIFILTTVGGLFHIPINPFYVLLPFIGGIYYLKKQSTENIDFLKQFLILLLIIMVSFILTVAIWDSSWDGRWYHSATLILLKNGWMPIYHRFTEFAANCHVHPESALWASYYPKFVEIVGANIYKITNLIESAKAVNFIMLSAVFMYAFSILKEFKPQNKFIPLILSVIIVLNPVCICQWFTNFIDLQLYFTFALLVLTILKIEKQQYADKTGLFMFVCSSLILAMTKYTGCMYLFVICFIYFIYILILKRSFKKYIKTVFLIGGLIAVTGVHPFYTNLRDYGQPFYPIFGKQVKNILDHNMPYGFEKMSVIERFFRSNFSETVHSRSDSADATEILKVPVVLKVPLTINIKYFNNFFYCADITVGGFGYFWSGILLLSLFYLPFMRFRNKNEKYLFWLITAMVIASTFSNPHCWWARYVPQFWLFPIFIILFGLLQNNYKNKFSKISKLILLYFIILVFIINSFIVLKQNTQFHLILTKLLKAPYDYIDSIKTPQNKIYLMAINGPQDMMADETIIPHLEEYYGKESIIYVPFDENKIISQEFIPIQYANIINKPCYFFKIGKDPKDRKR